jgi:predicted RNase H-like HicB family nuclease
MKTLHLKNVVWQEGEYFVAQCLNVEVSSFGDTKQDALENLDEALALYFEDVDADTIQNINNPEIVDREMDYA